MAIESVSVVDDRTLEITVLGGVAPCFIIDRVDVDETADRVTLTVHAGSEPGAICIQIIEEAMATVTLDRPLGDRQVVDGSDGSVVPVGSG